MSGLRLLVPATLSSDDLLCLDHLPEPASSMASPPAGPALGTDGILLADAPGEGVLPFADGTGPGTMAAAAISFAPMPGELLPLPFELLAA